MRRSSGRARHGAAQAGCHADNERSSNTRAPVMRARQAGESLAKLSAQRRIVSSLLPRPEYTLRIGEGQGRRGKEAVREVGAEAGGHGMACRSMCMHMRSMGMAWHGVAW